MPSLTGQVTRFGIAGQIWRPAGDFVRPRKALRNQYDRQLSEASFSVSHRPRQSNCSVGVSAEKPK